jgi:hypothetical protein
MDPSPWSWKTASIRVKGYRLSEITKELMWRYLNTFETDFEIIGNHSFSVGLDFK